MTIILPDQHPAAAILNNQGIGARTISEVSYDQPRARIAIVNLMHDPAATEADFSKSLSGSQHTLEIASYTTVQGLVRASETVQRGLPENASNEAIKKFAKAQHLSTFSKPLTTLTEDIQHGRIHGVILSGFARPDIPIQPRDPNNPDSGLDFYENYTRLLNDLRAEKVPTFASCWAAQAALFHFHGIERYKRPEKLTGVFEQALENKDRFVKGLETRFKMPLSRNWSSNEEQLRNNPNLITLAGGDLTGTTIAREKDAPIIYVSGHPEYEADTLLKETIRDNGEYRRKLAKGNLSAKPAPIPQNYDLLNPKNEWMDLRLALLGNFADAAYEFSSAKIVAEQTATNDNAPFSVLHRAIQNP